MGSERARARCRERIEALADATTDLDSVRREAIGELRRAIGFDRWCVLLVDPDTLLMSRGIGHNDWARDLPRLNVEDAGTADVNSLLVLARSRDHAAALRAATGGRPRPQQPMARDPLALRRRRRAARRGRRRVRLLGRRPALARQRRPALRPR